MDFDDYIDPYRPFSDEVDTLLALFHDDSPNWTVQQLTPCFRHLLEDYVERLLNRPACEREKHVHQFLKHAAQLGSAPPSQAELDQAPVLHGWCAAVLGSTPFLIGQSTGHPLLRRGVRTRTSPLFQIAPDYAWARTWNRYYALSGYTPELLFKLQADGVVAADVQLIRLDRSSLH
ncbi:DUF6634 family protein [Phaeobacter sp. CAU 1743]|uniref:DUF6634 family protein n=1 Tax=Phaeobacter sp. CAU 1743 TaxID=3140367 RepID=UPI00325A9B58